MFPSLCIFYFWLCWGFVAMCRLFCYGEWGYSLVAVHGLLLAVASLVAEHGLQDTQVSVVAAPGVQSTGSVVVVLELSCSAACGIFPDQESNPCLLHWQADSSPLSHQGSPGFCFSPKQIIDFLAVIVPGQVQAVISSLPSVTMMSAQFARPIYYVLSPLYSYPTPVGAHGTHCCIGRTRAFLDLGIGGAFLSCVHHPKSRSHSSVLKASVCCWVRSLNSW